MERHGIGMPAGSLARQRELGGGFRHGERVGHLGPANLERLAGRPARIIDNANGWATWDYGEGRAITFDQRGRAQSLTGFATQ